MRRGLHENHPRISRIERAKLLVHPMACQFRNGTRQFDAGRAATHNEEGEQG
jgi:hypothetical protein